MTGAGHKVGADAETKKKETKMKNRSISCELQDLEDIMKEVGILLTGDDYDEAQDYLQESCPCSTYNYLLEMAGA
jgi:hypothetical protein